ncbi:MAG: Rhs-family protein [Myxococcales bacterium]|nr:Rhs-family protein [Myxococcales bacterium]
MLVHPLMRASLLLWVSLVLVVGCGPRVTGATDGGGGDDVDAPTGEDGGIDADLCTGGTLCGSPAMCCAAGNECVEDRCLPACSSGVRCGATLDTCCGTGEVCLSNACVVPGTACSDPYDCAPGDFCEPTLNQCLPQPDPLTCQIVPTFADLQVVSEWSSTADEIISIPVVANLDGLGAPEVVVNLAQQDGLGFPGGRIQILDGATGAIKVAKIPHNPPTSYGSHGRSTIAVGDVSGDSLPDIIYAARFGSGGTGRSLIVAIDHTGALLWVSHDANNLPYGIKVENGGATLANFDADPQAEIVFGGTLIDHTGLVVWDQGGGGNGGYLGTNGTYQGGISAIADLDNDGISEIISGKNAWKVAWNGAMPSMTTVTAYWTYAGNDGYPAVADLDKDGTPEVVLVASGMVIALDGQTGQLFCAIDPTDAMCTANPALRTQPRAIPGGTTSNIGGPPTIADFDGDGRPEIGVAGGYSYSVYDLRRPMEDISGITPTPAAGALFVRWSKTTHDLSSNATGSSVFDFQGDGSAEVVYQDECNVWVYSGTDGRTQLQIPNTTGTIHEYPLVVDADGDGNSEIIVVANDSNAAGDCPGQTPRRGIYVYGDPNDRWVPTRKVWTQHSYHVTNATTAGNVPTAEDPNWAQPGLNDYRKNAQGEGVFNAPDLAVELAVGLDQCISAQIVLDARVTNLGALGVVPGVVVTFYQGTNALGPVLGTATTTTPILPGGSAHAKLPIPAPMMPSDYFAVVDSARTVAECDETNNQDDVAGATCVIIQ